MSDFESMLTRWQSAGILDAGAADRIRAYEAGQKKPAGLRWEGLVALILGGILLACGVVLFVSAHWDDIGPGARFALVMAMVAVFHIGGAATRENSPGLSTTLHAVGTVATGAAIALVGQIFNIEEHWPAAVLLWAIAALAGWALLHDQAQQILALLLVPAWMVSEITFYTERHIGQDVYIGRFLFVWAVLYLTFFLGSRRKAVQGILFTAAAIAAVTGTVFLLEGWTSWYGTEGFFPFGTRVWAWIAIAALPLLIAAFKGHKGLIPPAAAIAFVLALPWCQRVFIEHYDSQVVHNTYTHYGPNLLAYVLVIAFAVFLTGWGLRSAEHFLAAFGIAGFTAAAIWFANSNLFSNWFHTVVGQLLVAGAAVFVAWLGVRGASKLLINLGMVGFAAAVAWFYWSDIFDKIGRSLGLIGLGILFLLGGWALDKMRRRLILSAMNSATAQEAL